MAELAKKHGAYSHTDAVQAFGKIPVDFSALNVHAMTISSHKIHGPLGAGALILDKRVDISAFMLGGGQEKGLRSGTENLAAIVGFGLASELAVKKLASNAEKTQQLRAQLELGLHRLGATIFSEQAKRLPNTSFFAFNNIEGETLVMALDRKAFAVASGSACSSDSTEPSHVLLSMAIAPDLARGAIRVSLDASNSSEQIAQFLVVLEQELIRLKQMLAIAA
jgi:cysteine desulfurase